MVAEAVVIPLPVTGRVVLACGCYQAALPGRGRMRWLRFPSAFGGSGLFSTEDGTEILERGWLVMDGVRATARPAELGCPHWVEMSFLAGDWTLPHP